MAATGRETPAVTTNPRPRDRNSWKTQRWVFLALAAVFIAIRLLRLTGVCLDGDEIFSVVLARKNWGALISAAAADSVHPPLFYCVLKIWLWMGTGSLLWVRLLPALFEVLALAPILLLGRELGLQPLEINGAVALAAFHPLLIYHAQNARMYSLLMLCGLTSLWLFHRGISAGSRPVGGRFAALTAANIVLVYDHYYGWLIVSLECCYLLLRVRRHWWRGLLSAAVVLLAFSPWLWVAARSAMAKGGVESNLDWIPKPNLHELIWFFVDLVGLAEFPHVYYFALPALAAVVLTAVWYLRRANDASFDHLAGFLAFFALGPVAIALTASLLLPSSVWGHRHLIFIAVPLLMLLSASVVRLPCRALHIAAAALLLVWAGVDTQIHWRGDRKKPPLDALVLEMLGQAGGGARPAPVFVLDKHLHFALEYYLADFRAGRNSGMAVTIPPADATRLAEAAGEIRVVDHAAIENARGSRFWVATNSESWNRSETPEAILTARGCRTGAALRAADRYRTISLVPASCDSGLRP